MKHRDTQPRGSNSRSRLRSAPEALDVQPSQHGPQRCVHVAIVHRGYLEAILAGRKRVEARLSQSRCAPFGRVTAGDVVFFKETGGTIRARAIVDRVESYASGCPGEIVRRALLHAAEIAAPRAFWERKHAARYATLVWLRDVRETTSGPDHRSAPGFTPRGAWFVLPMETAPASSHVPRAA
ncbi:MAG: ASCH domain-containing protein [Planctomycetota bacterium]|nr:ASCH domain-containing protein [Planctomycetota bacterium]